MSWEVIDISYYQSISNYTTLANAVDGVILRCGYRGYGSSGSLVKDSALETHYAGLAGKTKLGYYWFSQAISDAEARAEADYVIDTLLAGKQNDMPIYFDSEIADTTSHSGRADKLSKAARTQYCVTWINRIQERGYRAGVYASESWFVSNLDFSQLTATGASIWVAKYSSSAPTTSTYDAWQYTSSASVPGLSPRFDQSTFYKDVAGWSGGAIPDSIVISHESISIGVGETFQLSAYALPSNADQNIDWESYSSAFATVSSTGLVTGVAATGRVDIWAEARQDHNVYATCRVEVTSGGGSVPVESVEVSPRNISIAVGETYQLSAHVNPSNASNQKIDWESHSSAFATVDSSGRVTGVAPTGRVDIWAEANENHNIYDTCVVEVTNGGSSIPVESVEVSPKTVTVAVGETVQLSAHVLPTNATNQGIDWESYSSAYATVDSSGRVTGVTPTGRVDIWAEANEDHNIYDTCQVKVVSQIVHVTGVSLNKSQMDIMPGSSETLVATITPGDATDTSVTWSSSNSSIATVDGNGTVTAVKAGSATITVSTNDGGYTATCNVTVGVPVTGVTLNKSTLNLDISQTETLVATVLPNNATNKNVTWSSSNTSVATVNSNGLVNPVGNGTCTITVTTQDGGYKATCSVTVTTRITGIHLNKVTTKIERDSSETLIATLEPATATPKPITWSTSDSSIATVDNNGKVNALKTGVCRVSASVESFTASCEIRVIVYPTNITIDPTETEYIVNEQAPMSLKVIFEPEDCTERDIVWSSTNPEIAQYDQENDVVEFTGEGGECYIEARDVKNHRAQCKLSVYIRQEPPVPPLVESYTEHSITLVQLERCEYSIDDAITWQSSPTFDGLEPNTRYYFVQRYVTEGYYLESEPSDFGTGYTKDIIHVESVELDTHELSFDVTYGSKIHKFTTTVLPEDAEIKDVFYRFDNTSIGYIDSSGTLTVNNYGEGNVTVISLDNGVTDTCNVKVYKRWETPEAPMVIGITKDTVTAASDDNTVFSIDDGKSWVYGPIITGLKPKSSYNIICKTIASGYRLESKISSATLIVTPEEDPDPSGQILPLSITLSAHQLYFDLNKNTYATLSYKINPIDAINNVVWYSSDNSIIKVNTNGEVYAVGVGKAMVFIRTVYGGKIDCCECYVYRTPVRPDPPTVEKITEHSIKLVDNILYEFSIDGEDWQSSPLFEGLLKDSYYTLYQRTKGIGDYQPPSEPSYGMTVKTLTDETPGGESPSGYTWGQQVDVENIPVYTSPYAFKPDFTLTGRFFIFNLIESNHRIRLTDIEKYVGVYGHSLGWVNVADLKLIIDAIYEGDKVIVDGDINVYADGSGPSIHKDKAEMYITDIIIGQEFMYGVTPKPGMNRQGFAKADQVVKYKIIDVNNV